MSISSISVPSLRRATVWTAPPCSGSSPATARVSTSGRPSMRAATHPNSSSAGRLQRVTAPSRSVRTKRASTSWRSNSSTASAWAVAGLDSGSDTSFPCRHESGPTQAPNGNLLAIRPGGFRAPARPLRLRQAHSGGRARGPQPSETGGPVAGRDRGGRGCSATARGAWPPERRSSRRARSVTSCWPSVRWPTSEPASLKRDLGAEIELERLAHVVQDRRAQEQVGVEPGVERAGLVGERPDGHRVLDQPAEVGVVPRTRAGGAPEVRAEGVVAEERVAAGAEGRRRTPRARGARGSRPAPPCRDTQQGGTRRDRWPPPARA